MPWGISTQQRGIGALAVLSDGKPLNVTLQLSLSHFNTA